MNLEYGILLLTFGFVIYVENLFRNRLAMKLNLSIQAKSSKSETGWARCLNAIFGILTMIHLAYLGAPFDQLYMEERKLTFLVDYWKSLGFFSHWFMVPLLIVSFLL